MLDLGCLWICLWRWCPHLTAVVSGWTRCWRPTFASETCAFPPAWTDVWPPVPAASPCPSSTFCPIPACHLFGDHVNKRSTVVFDGNAAYCCYLLFLFSSIGIQCTNVHRGNLGGMGWELVGTRLYTDVNQPFLKCTPEMLKREMGVSVIFSEGAMEAMQFPETPRDMPEGLMIKMFHWIFFS